MNYQFLQRRLFFKNNSAYWLGKYLGITGTVMTGLEVGILLTILYLKAIQDKLPNEIETLSEADRYNEYMTGLRTIWGVSLDRIKRIWTDVYRLFDETSSEILE
jgi:oxygen-independent coproporphyrinogen-3 oxidase